MRLLWLTPEAPDPGGTGGEIRLFHVIRGLARLGAEIEVIAPAYPPQAERCATLQADGIRLRLARRPESRPLEAVHGMARRPALAVTPLRDPWLCWQADVFWTEVAPSVERSLAECDVDAVLVEHDFASAWAGRLPSRLRVGLVFQNATWRYWARRAQSAHGLARAASRIEATRMRRHVGRALPRYERAWTVSEGDGAAVRELAPDLPVGLSPNGVDVARLAGLPVAGGQEGSLILTGTMSYPPNAEAAVWFVREVLPRLRTMRPDSTFTIVGRDPSEAVRRLADVPGVEVTGRVERIEPYLARAAVAVAPLLSGGGTKLKVLEALAAGRPVVATPVAAEGIEVVDGRDLVVAAHAEPFASAVAELLADPARRTAMAAAGRAAVVERYDWTAIAAALHRDLREWLGGT
jgi:glycosyltransferase involved in cell wall biosynthesis